MATLAWSSLSERGLRPKNDDATFAGTIGKYTTFVIADGLPGHPDSGHVNTIAINTLINAVKSAEGRPQEALMAGIRAADTKVRDLAGKFQNPGGFATKLVACLIDDGLVCTALDTGEGNIHVITETLIENGRAAARSRGNFGPPFDMADREPAALTDMISHVLGAPHRLKPADFSVFPLCNDFLCLSSDGLTDHLGENEIADIVREKGRYSLDAAAEALVQEALYAGSESTITVILARGIGS